MQDDGRDDPYQPADVGYRAQARALLMQARHAALGVQDPQGMAVLMALIALAPGPEGGAPLSLMSDLAQHKRALRKAPRCGLLIGDVPQKGDVLSGPRLSLRAEARFLTADETAEMKAHYLRIHPKARLYFQLGDFTLVRFCIIDALLNAGFGRACRLSGRDLAQQL